MRILHTSDWHIGKKVNEFSMEENQKYVFEQMYSIIKDEKIDVLLVAGDIYDKSIVDIDAVKFLDEIFTKLIQDLKIKVICISGNHDSSHRLAFSNDILSKSGLYIEGDFKGKINPIILNDEFGEVNFYPLSYFDYPYIRNLFDDNSINSSDEALKSIIKNQNIDYFKRNVFIGHGYFSNCNMDFLIESDSERRLSIGGQDVMDSSILKKFDYVALGHLHGRQKIEDDHIRYSGSIVKYSFSEINHSKGVSVISLKEKGNIDIKHVELRQKYDMKKIEGFLEVLLQKSFYENLNLLDYYHITLHDSIGILDPVSKLRKVYKNLMEVRFLESFSLDEDTYFDSIEKVNKSPLELFKGFYKTMLDKELSEEHIDILEDVIEKAYKDIL